jgi:transposase-like protein
VSAIDKDDYYLIEALAPDLTVRELAEKWEVSPNVMRSWLWRNSITAKPEPAARKGGALWHKSLKGQHISPRIAEIIEHSKRGIEINEIAKSVKSTPNYVCRIQEIYGLTDRDKFYDEMMKKVDRIGVFASSHETTKEHAALVLYGWTKGKYHYWRRKKAANKSG